MILEAIKALEFHSPLAVLVREHGKVYQSSPRKSYPKGLRRKRAMKECFSNSVHHLIKEHISGTSNLLYVEGYAVNKGIGFPFHHAWLVERDSDVAIDVTLDKPEEYEYFGIALDRALVFERMQASGYYCVFCPGEMFSPEAFEAVSEGAWDRCINEVRKEMEFFRKLGEVSP